MRLCAQASISSLATSQDTVSGCASSDALRNWSNRSLQARCHSGLVAYCRGTAPSGGCFWLMFTSSLLADAANLTAALLGMGCLAAGLLIGRRR
jgi:hypothetical protein